MLASARCSSNNVHVPVRQTHQNGSRRQASTGILAEARRMRDRAKWVGNTKQFDETSIFGARLGNQFDLNWALARNHIPPQKDAFHNLHLRGLLQQAEGKTVDGDKALVVSSNGVASKVKKYTVAKDADPNNNVVSEPQYKQFFFKEVRDYLVDKELYVTDGSVGTHRSAQVNVRVITDSAASALYLRHMLARRFVPESYHFPHNLVIYYAPKMVRLEQGPPETYGLNGFEGGSGVLLERVQPQGQKNLVLVGNDSTDLLRSTIASHTASEILSKQTDVLPLSCDSIISKDGQSTTLVFSTANTFLQQRADVSLFGTHNHFWGPQGVVRGFEGVTYPSKDGIKFQRGDVIEYLADGGVRATVPLQSGNITRTPQNIVFLVADAEGALPTISKLTATQAAQHFLAGYDGKGFNSPFFDKDLIASPDANKIITTFRKLVEDNKVNAYLVNIVDQKTTMKREDLTKLLGIIADNQVGSAKLFQLPTLSAVMSIPNFKNLYGNQERTQKFDKQLTDHLQKKYPTVSFS